MRNILAFVAAVTLTVGGLGWYLDWYRIRSRPAPTGQRSLTIDINTAKIGADIHKGEQSLQKVLEDKGKDKETEKDKDSSRGSGKDGRGAAEKGGPVKGVQPGGGKHAPGKGAKPEVEAEDVGGPSRR
jgi:hypothetical protein